MANRKTPGFVRDTDQAAELAAVLTDTAAELERELEDNRRAASLSGRQLVQAEQTIARYRRWAAELTDTDDTDAPAPVQIRPATRAHTEEATG